MQASFRIEDLYQYKSSIPPIDEQIKITNFLDHETAKIDALIEKQQQLIKLLKEKRQAVISHAVTKGLTNLPGANLNSSSAAGPKGEGRDSPSNPDAPMRDSGVEWLGEVPAHWIVTRAKFISHIFVPQRNKPELNDSFGVAWATMEDMKGIYIENTKKFVSKEASKVAGSKKLKAGSVIASCVGNFGVSSINKIDLIINQQLQAFIPNDIKPEYLREIVALSEAYFDLIGTAATLIYVNQQGFENLPVVVPPNDEQEAICAYVEMKSSRFDALVEKSERAIGLLQERRAALISAAVTGKIDVRNWQSPNQQESCDAA
jgi:type I restriction enzyme S subunit